MREEELEESEVICNKCHGLKFLDCPHDPDLARECPK